MIRPLSPPGARADEGAVRQVERPSQPTDQRQDQLVGIEAGLSERLGRLPQLLLLWPHGRVQPVPDAGMQPGAELGQVDRRRQRVRGTQRQRGSRRITVRWRR